MSWQNFKVLKINRQIIGNNIDGNVIHPWKYTNVSKTAIIRSIQAYFTAAELGKKVVWVYNISSEINNISTTTITEVDKTDNWIYLGTSEVMQYSTNYIASYDMGTSIGIVGVACYIPESSLGDQKVISL